MPDAGDFERKHPAGAPGDWVSAFAALPLDAPDAHAWQRVQARLPSVAPTGRVRWPLWLAAAASLALAIAIPTRMQSDPVDAAGVDVAKTPATKSTAPGAVDLPGNALAVGDAAPPPVSPDAVASTETPSQPDTARRPSTRRPVVPPSARPIRTLAQPARIQIAAADTAAALEPLYAQSAQLEGLLALARDDRVASGAVAALTDRLDTEVAEIDAALIQPDLPDQRRSELWGERVDTLRQLVGVEATQRLLAAHGQQYQAALVSID